MKNDNIKTYIAALNAQVQQNLFFIIMRTPKTYVLEIDAPCQLLLYGVLE